MALQWKWTDRIGKAVIRQHEREYELGIYDGNALAIFICEYKNEEGEDMYQLYNFISDRKHLENIVKNNHRIISDEVVSVELNISNKNALAILPLLAKEVGEVRCYYKKPE